MEGVPENVLARCLLATFVRGMPTSTECVHAPKHGRDTDRLEIDVRLSVVAAPLELRGGLWLPATAPLGTLAADTASAAGPADGVPAFAVTLVPAQGSPSATAPTPAARDFVVVVDTSGSMQGLLKNVIATVGLIRNALAPADRIGIVDFNHEATPVFPITRVDAVHPLRFDQCLGAMQAGGGTNIAAGIAEALRMVVSTLPLPPYPHAGPRNQACVLLLSDGYDMAANGDLVDRAADILHGHGHSDVTIHSLGFGDSHDSDTLARLTHIGSGGPGSYYPISDSPDDIPSAVGDCLGGIRSDTWRGLTVSAALRVCGREHPLDLLDAMIEGHQLVELVDLDNSGDHPDLDAQPPDDDGVTLPCTATLGAGMPTAVSLRSEQPHTVVYVGLGAPAQKDWTDDAAIVLRLAARDGTVVTQVLPLDGDGETAKENDRTAAIVTVATHALRVQAAHVLLSLARLSIGGTLRPEGPVENLHTAVLNLLQRYQDLPDSEVTNHGEGVLISLEQDLGGALERLQRDRECSARDFMLFRCFGEEHRLQRNVGMASSFRTAYSTELQLQSKLSFLAKARNDARRRAHQASPVAATVFEQAALSPSELALRRERQATDVCFVTMGDCDDSHLGIGLLVKPRSLRERLRGLLPTIEIVEDYLSAEGFNAGVRNQAISLQQLDTDTADDECRYDEPETVMTGTARRRINAWMPLFISHEHWHRTAPLAPSAFSLLATQWNAPFVPAYALDVCCRVLCCAVVKFTAEDERASDRAVQMAADVHRTMVQMALDHPEVQAEATRRLKAFMGSAQRRSRSSCANLGDVLPLLAIADVKWSELQHTFIPELIRRQVRWSDEKIRPQHHDSLAGLAAVWPAHVGKVTGFCLAFLQVVAGIEGRATLAEVAARCDVTWSKLPEATVRSMKASLASILAEKDLATKIRQMCTPSSSAAALLQTDRAVHELLLWAVENAPEETAKRLELGQVVSGHRVSEHELRRRLFLLCQKSPTRVVTPMVDPKPPLPPTAMTGVGSTVTRMAPERHRHQGGNNGGSAVLASDAAVVQLCECSRCKRMQAPAPRPNAADGDDPNRMLFVAKVPPDQTPAAIAGMVESLTGSPPVSVDLIVDCNTGKPKGYGFVRFEAESHAVAALNYAAVDPATTTPEGWQTPIVFDVCRRQLLPRFRPIYLGGGVGAGRGTVKNDPPRLTLGDATASKDVLNTPGAVLWLSAVTDGLDELAACAVAARPAATCGGDVCFLRDSSSWPRWLSSVYARCRGDRHDAVNSAVVGDKGNGDQHSICARVETVLAPCCAADQGWMPLTPGQVVCAIDPVWVEMRQYPRSPQRSLVLRTGDAMLYNDDASDAYSAAYAVRQWNAEPGLAVIVSFHRA